MVPNITMKVSLVIVYILFFNEHSESLPNLYIEKIISPSLQGSDIEVQIMIINKKPKHSLLKYASDVSIREQLTRSNRFIQLTENPGAIVFPSGIPSEINQGMQPGRPTTKKPMQNSLCQIESGMIMFNGKCHQLLTDLPCGNGKWLILNSKGIPECAINKCQFGKLFYMNKCVNVSSITSCGISEMLYVEFTGEIYCDCEPDFLFDEDLNQCQAEHSRGSCPFGKQLEVTADKEIACVVNPCIRDDLVLNPLDKKCYKKTFVGKCSNERKYELLFTKEGNADCTSLDNRNYYEVPALSSCAAGSKRNPLRECQRLLRRASSFRVPSHFTARYEPCPSSYTRYPTGDCRKPNPRLG